MIPSICLFCDLSNLVRHLHQYLWIDTVVSTESNTGRCRHYLRLDQTCWVNGQSLHRWVGVSGLIPHSLQIRSLDQLRFVRLLVSGSSCVKVSMQRNVVLIPLLLSKLALILACYRSPQTVSGKHFWLSILYFVSITSE
jgi:hypothetical protein